jgi:hypothetical protein
MKTLILAGGLLLATSIAMPRTAAADVSVAIGLPGVGIFVGDHGPVYHPPVYYAPPAPVFVHHRHHHHGWYKKHYRRASWHGRRRHHRHCDD